MIQSVVTGVCTNRQDPQQLLRIKVKSEQLLRTGAEIPDWISPEGLRLGEVDVPEEGELVEIVYDDTGPDDRRPGETAKTNPNYRWRPFPVTGVGDPAQSASGSLPAKLPKAMAQDYPNRRGWFSRRGHCFFFGDNKDERAQIVVLMHRKGHTITLQADGGVVIQAFDGSTMRMTPSGKSILLASSGGASATLDADQATLMGPKGDYVNITDGEIEVVAKTTVKLTAPAIVLAATQVIVGEGADAGEPPAKATTLKSYLDGHTHPIAVPVVGGGGGTATGTSGAPATPVTGIAATKSKVT